MLRIIDIPPRELEERAQDRILWRHIATEAYTECATKRRITSAMEKEKHVIYKRLPTSVRMAHGNVLRGLDFLVTFGLT